ncbi:hypothetical protein P3Q42_000662 [Listeria innocua]|uniref:hypothetical protein n=1 Tax=Listeria innocua TaxID=1642 RepID=UPI001424E363|nr:hypothetical protein [Listeria innocua]EAH4448592.1 hypothetical protein [Listeria innocua]EDO1201618.1 hypothetical protein [Listeria innocua]EKO3230961.1 hypothetical protein [Listeria innocua]EKQ5084588.1 hypothetical protein [Listeria innocua]EKQ5093154.1 hypothetical protein [Listeria innocua]
MKIKDYEDKLVKDEVEVDYYVPVTVSFSENDDKYGLGEFYYYRFVNEHESFVEIKINSVTRKVVEVVFTSINDIEDSNLTIEEYTEKNPVIQIDIFEEISIITKESGFKIFRGNKKIYFKLDEEKVDSIVKMSSHVSLFLNEDSEIIGLYFSSFSDNQWAELNESIKSTT